MAIHTCIQDFTSKWRLPTLRSLTLHGQDSGFGRLVLPILRALFSDAAPTDRFPFPGLTHLEIEVSEPMNEIDPTTRCGRKFTKFVALLPRIAASGIHTLRVRGASAAECEIVQQQRKNYLWMDLGCCY